MPNYNENFVPLRSPDKVSLGKIASNPQERLAALQSTLANDWAGLDIGRLERSDTANFHGWLMWPYVST
jgi:hypothetical protein